MLYVPEENDFAKRFDIVIRTRDAFPFPPNATHSLNDEY